MYELISLPGNAYYADCPAKVGIVCLGNGEVVFIDGGSDKDAGRKMRQILDKNGWTLKAIYNTHSHADHIGGNAYLQAQTGCRIYTPQEELPSVLTPLFEPTLLYGGCPFDDLRCKFLMAAPSDAQSLTDEALPESLTAVPLPGHSPGMTGYKTADGVFFIGDSLVSHETLEKYKVSYLWDVEASLATLDNLQKAEAALFVPSHAAPVENICPLAEENKAAILAIAEELTIFCREPRQFDDILAHVFDHYALSMNIIQHSLIGSTVRSYLAYLKGTGNLTYEFCDNRLLWRKA